MTVDTETALGIAAIERVERQKAETAAIKAAAAAAALERVEKQMAVEAATKAAAEAAAKTALEAEKTRQWLASDSMNLGISSPVPPPPMGSGGVSLCVSCNRERRL
jgi:septal ring factor EnvC (AmiA/AmiB activator)